MTSMNLNRFKFRGKCNSGCNYSVDGSGWVYGNLIIGADGNFAIVDERNCPIQIADTGDWKEDWVQIPVIENTVGRCTGLRDKNDELIYDGDVIAISCFRRGLGENYGVIEVEEVLHGVIEYDTFGLLLKQITSKNRKWEEYIGLTPEEECTFTYLHDICENSITTDYEIEVLGNIHESPKLEKLK